MMGGRLLNLRGWRFLGSKVLRAEAQLRWEEREENYGLMRVSDAKGGANFTAAHKTSRDAK
jgi:hypothetical protein